MKFLFLCFLGTAVICELSLGSTLKRQRSRPARRSRDEATNAALVDTVSKFIEEERESFDLLVDELKADSKNINKMRGVRLIGSDGYPSRSVGRLEVFMHGEWGTVCDDGEHYWGHYGPYYSNSTLARVVCKGRNHYCNDFDAHPGVIPSSAFKVNVPHGIWLDDVKCYGYEENIFECRSSKRHNCHHNEDIAIDCCYTYDKYHNETVPTNATIPDGNSTVPNGNSTVPGGNSTVPVPGGNHTAGNNTAHANSSVVLADEPVTGGPVPDGTKAPEAVTGGGGAGTAAPVPVTGGGGAGTAAPVPVTGGGGAGTAAPEPVTGGGGAVTAAVTGGAVASAKARSKKSIQVKIEMMD